MMQPALAAPVYVEIVVTADDPEGLAELTQTLVAERLAAYGYLTPPVQAAYHDDDGVHVATHARAIFHTRATLVSDVIDRLDHYHPDEVRSVVATQLVDGRSDYLQWVAHETAANVDHRSALDRRRMEQRQGRSPWSWHRPTVPQPAEGDATVPSGQPVR